MSRDMRQRGEETCVVCHKPATRYVHLKWPSGTDAVLFLCEQAHPLGAAFLHMARFDPDQAPEIQLYPEGDDLPAAGIVGGEITPEASLQGFAILSCENYACPHNVAPPLPCTNAPKIMVCACCVHMPAEPEPTEPIVEVRVEREGDSP